MDYQYVPMQPRDMHNKCCGGRAWCVQVGVTFFFPPLRVTQDSLFQDICGIICAVMTWILILYAEFVVMAVIVLPSAQAYPVYSTINMIIFNMLSFLAFASHMRTMFSDPVGQSSKMTQNMFNCKFDFRAQLRKETLRKK